MRSFKRYFCMRPHIVTQSSMIKQSGLYSYAQWSSTGWSRLPGTCAASVMYVFVLPLLLLTVIRPRATIWNMSTEDFYLSLGMCFGYFLFMHLSDRNNIAQCYCFSFLIKYAVLVAYIKDFFQKHQKLLTTPKFWTAVYININLLKWDFEPKNSNVDSDIWTSLYLLYMFTSSNVATF